MSRHELLEELDVMEAIQTRMRGLLNEVACAVKGPARPGEAHDWGDLPEKVAKLVAEHRHLKAWWSEHMARVAEGYDDLADNLATVRKAATAEGFQLGVQATLQRLAGRVPALPAPALVEPDEVI